MRRTRRTVWLWLGGDCIGAHWKYDDETHDEAVRREIAKVREHPGVYVDPGDDVQAHCQRMLKATPKVYAFEGVVTEETTDAD